MFVLRLRSFHALEQTLRQRPGWRAWLGPGRRPSADTLGRVLARLDLPALRALVATVNRRAWRAKMIHGPVGEGYRVGAVDGHGLWGSRGGWGAEWSKREVAGG